jgi:hypothetical protein
MSKILIVINIFKYAFQRKCFSCSVTRKLDYFYFRFHLKIFKTVNRINDNLDLRSSQLQHLIDWRSNFEIT